MSNLEFPTLETTRLLLNRLTTDDREPLFAIFSDPDIIEHYDVERFKKINKAEQLITYFMPDLMVTPELDGQFVTNHLVCFWVLVVLLIGTSLTTVQLWVTNCLHIFGAKVMHQRRLALLSILFFLTIFIFMCIVLKHSFYQAISHQKNY